MTEYGEVKKGDSLRIVLKEDYAKIGVVNTINENGITLFIGFGEKEKISQRFVLIRKDNIKSIERI